ncbi:MAG: response regulator [Chloroflexota bacterium]|nr:response regulator [Chloroflexota bacterium]
MAAPLVAIVEDDRAVLEMIAECLAVEGYHTLAYRQGAGAYERIAERRPDAVVLDIRLEHPRAGLSVLQRLRRDPATATIPVLVCTADVAFTREWARTLGAHRCAVITKPFAIADLIATVACLINPPSDDGTFLRWDTARAQRSALPAIRPVVGLVDADGKGATAHTAQLEQKGYKVVVCRWGDGILDLAVCQQPDVLLVDPGNRPRGAVSYVLRRLGRDPLTGHIPIVVDPPQGGEFYRRIEEIVGPAPTIGSSRESA